MSVGRTSEIHKATEEVQHLAEEIRGDLEAKTGRHFPEFKAIEYMTQLVSGINYFVRIQVDDNDYIHVRIFKPLPHTGNKPEVSNYQTSKTKDDSLTYF
uniref:Cystatin domain-containing protein n=1 Tax=Arion vulgaris TaxID=1028688 RepID=A0A0B6Z7H4_9EUPU